MRQRLYMVVGFECFELMSPSLEAFDLFTLCLEC